MGIDTKLPAVLYSICGQRTRAKPATRSPTMALSLHPTTSPLSRIGIVATSLVGDVKGEWYTDSTTEAANEAARLVSWPDTQVWLYNTDNSGNRTGSPFAVVSSSSGYTPCMFA